MSYKALVFGVPLALVAVVGANASENIVAEPEPMEYVKVCDAFGKGFFYIPGTETCLRFNGYIRSEFIYTDNGAVETTDWRYRGRLNVDARNDTDWGMLKSVLRFQGNGRGGGDGNLEITKAMASLGGLSFGYSTIFFSNVHDDGWQKAAFDAYYLDDEAVYLQYTYEFEGAGFSATVGVQDTVSVVAAPAGSNVYDPYLGAKYEGEWGNVSGEFAGSAIYDSAADEWAWKASALIKANDSWSLKGWYAADNGGTKYVTGGSAPAVSWEWGVDVVYNLNDAFLVWAGYTDADFVDAERYGFGARWNPVSGLSIRPEAIFGPNFSQARLRVVRSF